MNNYGVNTHITVQVLRCMNNRFWYKHNIGEFFTLNTKYPASDGRCKGYRIVDSYNWIATCDYIEVDSLDNEQLSVFLADIN